jgi:hypothetical protein
LIWNLIPFDHSISIQSLKEDLIIGDGLSHVVMSGPEWGGLGEEDLSLTVVEVNTKDSILDSGAISGIEDVADDLTLIEAGVGDISMNLTVNIVCECDKELATSEAVELIIDPLLSESIVNYALSLSSAVEGLCELEEIWVAVEVAPNDLSVIGIISTWEALLRSIVEEGDTSGS